MKIGDKVLIKGTIDEIRKDIVIIKNEGGYFGTVPSEIIEDWPRMGDIFTAKEAEEIRERIWANIGAAKKVKTEYLKDDLQKPKEKPQKPKAVAPIPKKVVAGSGSRKKLDDGKMLALRRAGWTYQRIAEEMGCTDQTVINHIRDKEAKA